jgi:hypothetical protein
LLGALSRGRSFLHEGASRQSSGGL